MKLQIRSVLVAALAATILPIVLAMAGCGSNDTIKEDPAAVTKRVDAATKMRSYFDKSGGNYDSLSAEDKSALNALTGGEKHSREAFGHMVPSGGGGMAPSGPKH